METTTNQIEFTRVNNDRYVCHFLNFLSPELQQHYHKVYGMSAISNMYELALQRSRKLGGKKFHNKQYGGGIAFQMDAGQQQEMSRRILEIKNR